MRRLLVGLVGLLYLCPGLDAAAPKAPRYFGGGVTSGHAASSEAGLKVLRAGGDAVDAAVTVLMSLGVVTPQASGLGGGFFALVYRADERRTYVLDAREVAPAAASPEMYRPDGKLDAKLARWGGLSVAVPGEVRGMQAMHERWGRMPWKSLTTPAVKQAREGVPVNGYIAYVVDKVRRRFEGFPRAEELYLKDGDPYRHGEVYRNPELARTLEALGEKGPDWFYTGGLGQEIVASVRSAGGVLASQDMAGYQVKWRRPVSRRFRDFQVHSMPPPSSGGTVLLEMLGMLSHMPLEELGWNSSAYLHRLAEVMKIAYADRARVMADPDFHRVPVGELLSPKRLARLARTILPHRVRALSTDGKAIPEDGGTSHVSIFDKAGNVVCVTSTVNWGYGSLVVVPGRGFVMNNEMDDFTLDPGQPNMFGLVQGEQNKVEPGKRPLSSMCPTIVTRHGKPVLALGGSGGSRIITGTLQVLLSSLVFERPLQEAVNAPRIHHQWLPDQLRLEKGIPRDVQVGLRRRGHEIKQYDRVGGRVQALHFTGNGVAAASDPRKEGRPAGY